jgi:hypothetical protein
MNRLYEKHDMIQKSYKRKEYAAPLWNWKVRKLKAGKYMKLS